MQFIVTVISNAAVLVPLVVGLSLVFRISGTIVFAAGQIAVFSGMVYAVVDLPLYLRVPITLAVGVAAAVATYLAILPAQRLKVSPDAISLSTLGIAFVLEYIGIEFIGRQVFTAPTWISGTFAFLDASISYHRLLVVAVAIVVAIVVILIVDRTLVGRAMQATAFDPHLSQLYGIRVQRFRLLAWVIAGACMAVVGMSQVTLASASDAAAIPLLTLSLASAVVGGLGGLYAGIAGAVVIAVAQAAVTQFLSSELQMAIVFALLFIVLIFRPSGLFTNAREARRV